MTDRQRCTGRSHLRGTRPTRRTAALGSAGALDHGDADSRRRRGARRPAPTRRHGQDREARGAAIAAAAAAKAGIDWQDCPADWGFEKPIQCGWVTRAARLRASRTASRSSSPSTASATPARKEERQGALVYNPGGPGGSGHALPDAGSPPRTRCGPTPPKAYDFVGFDPRGVGHSAPISCIDPQEFVKAPKADPVPDSEADKRAQRKLAARVRGRLRRAQRQGDAPADDHAEHRARPGRHPGRARREEAQLPGRLLRHVPRRRLRRRSSRAMCAA